MMAFGVGNGAGMAAYCLVVQNLLRTVVKLCPKHAPSFLMLAACACEWLGCFYSPDIEEEPPEPDYPVRIQLSNISPNPQLFQHVDRGPSGTKEIGFRVNVIDENLEDTLKGRWVYNDTTHYHAANINGTGTDLRIVNTHYVDFCDALYENLDIALVTFAVTDGDWLDPSPVGSSLSPLARSIAVTDGSHLDYIQWTMIFDSPCQL